jgi:membrane-bound lytic murein transglycosylase MltF
VRQKQVDFSAPHLTGVDEIIVTGPAEPAIEALEDLAGKEIHVRASSSYYESLMQLLPSTAGDPNVNIREIDVMEHNIHAGVKYLRFLHDRYFTNEPMDALNKMLFTFASYNAGPGKVIRLRREARESGLDPDIWFRNVEIIAARGLRGETVQYVSNIYKYYIAYRSIIRDIKLKKEKKIRAN